MSSRDDHSTIRRGRLGIAGEPFLEQELAAGGCCAASIVILGAGVFDAPARPLAEGVISPVPAVLFKDLDAIAEVAIGAVVGRPANGAELADVNMHAVVALKVD